MCQYRYYYYGGCRHSETVLFAFCERAVPVAPVVSPAAPALEPEILKGKHPRHKHHPRRQGQVGSGGDGSRQAQSAGVGEREVPISSPLFTGLSPLHPAASSPNSAASIPAYPSHTSHETAVPEQDMAGLPTFSGSTFRRFMTGSGAAQQYDGDQKHPPSATPSLHYTRSRQPGIREHTDESYDLPNSNDILQHLTESYSSQEAPQSGIIGYDNIDSIEAEVNQLKEDLVKLREEEETGTPLPAPAQLHEEASRSPQRRKLPSPIELSAAARLQKMHEEAEQERLSAKARPPPEAPQPPPPSPMDFPTLGSPTASASSKPNTPTDARRPSYADAAMSGLPKKSTRAAAPPRSSLASQESAEEDPAAVTYQTEGKVDVLEQARPQKGAPHFAQPTQSYARRAGETLRKEAGFSPPKPVAEVVGTKSTKGQEPNFATEKRLAQRQQKRKSLPGGWMNEGADHDASPPSGEAVTKPAAASATSKQNIGPPASPTKIPVRSTGLSLRSETPATKPNSKVAQAQQSPRLQKKTSSYMSPTSATTQRTAANVSKEQPKRQSQSPKKRLPKLDTSPIKQVAVVRSPQITATGSDTSSVQFILDRPPALVSSPTAVSSSPVARYLEDQQMRRSSPVFGSPLGSPVLPRRSTVTENLASTATSIDHHGSQQVPAPDYGTLYSMPSVEKTTTVRRTSNQQILRPILARLNAEGLVRRNSQSSPRMPAAENVSNALSAAREMSPRSRRESEDRPDILPHARATGPIPPHRRNQQEAHGFGIRHFEVDTDTAPASLAPNETSALARISPYSSLRATASEFTPMRQPISPMVSPFGHSYNDEPQPPTQPQPQEVLPSYSLEELTAFRTPEEWMSMSVEHRMMINQLRSLISRQHPRYARSQPWGQVLPHNDVGASALGFTVVDGRGSPQNIGAMEHLKANMIADNKIVHWEFKNTMDEETPARFGRAAGPPSLMQDSPHATISPTSDDTSPLKTPRNLSARPWSIGSATSSTLPYGWTGGDGKEIRFVGYGPYAERDPNSAVSFDFHRRRSPKSTFTSSPGWDGGEENKENVSVTVAPRSQKQWAEKLGLDRVPCRDVEITQATEMVPFAGQLRSYCRDCYAGH